MELSGPYLAACALLAVAGVAKAVRPGDTARALAAALSGQPGPGRSRRLGRAVRAGSLTEAILGVAALVYLSPWLAGAVAASYASFSAFVLVARRRGGPLATCGCFGTLDTPPTATHLALDLGLGLSAIWTAADGATGWTTRWLVHQPWHGVPLVLLGAALAWLAALGLTDGARLVTARRLATGQARERTGAT